jgi:hypothetical protein
MEAADSSPVPTDADYDTFTACPPGLEPPPGAAPFRALKGGVHPGPFETGVDTFNAYVRKFIVRGITGVPMKFLVTGELFQLGGRLVNPLNLALQGVNLANG